MEQQSNKCYCLGTNCTIGTSGRVKWPLLSLRPSKIFEVVIMTCISPMEYQSNKCNCIGSNRTIGTNGRVEWTPTQPKAIEDIQSLYNDVHITNETLIK